MVLNSVLSAEFITTALDGAHRAIEIITALTPNWSDHPDVASDERCAGRQRGNELRIHAALAVGIVVELAGRGVVDDAVVAVVAAARARCSVEAAIARGELAGAPDRAERRAIEAQHVPGGGEVRHCVGIRRTVLPED